MTSPLKAYAGGGPAKRLAVKWYSALEKAIEAADPNLKLPLAKWRTYLEGKPGVKKEELDIIFPSVAEMVGPSAVTGDYNIPKTDLIDLVKHNSYDTDLQEFQTGNLFSRDQFKYTEQPSPLRMFKRHYEADPENPIVFDVGEYEGSNGELAAFVPGIGQIGRGTSNINSYLDSVIHQLNRDRGPKYPGTSTYRLPGGRDYKETVLGHPLAQPMRIDSGHFGEVPKVGESQISWAMHHTREDGPPLELAAEDLQVPANVQQALLPSPTGYSVVNTRNGEIVSEFATADEARRAVAELGEGYSYERTEPFFHVPGTIGDVYDPTLNPETGQAFDSLLEARGFWLGRGVDSDAVDNAIIASQTPVNPLDDVRHLAAPQQRPFMTFTDDDVQETFGYSDESWFSSEEQYRQQARDRFAQTAARQFPDHDHRWDGRVSDEEAGDILDELMGIQDEPDDLEGARRAFARNWRSFARNADNPEDFLRGDLNDATPRQNYLMRRYVQQADETVPAVQQPRPRGGFTYDEDMGGWLDRQGRPVTLGGGNLFANRDLHPMDYVEQQGVAPLDPTFREVAELERRLEQVTFENEPSLSMFDDLTEVQRAQLPETPEALLDMARVGDLTPGDLGIITEVNHGLGERLARLNDEGARRNPLPGIDDEFTQARDRMRDLVNRGYGADAATNLLEQITPHTTDREIASFQVPSDIEDAIRRYRDKLAISSDQKQLPGPKPKNSKVTFIDELQSYRHQKGRSEGYEPERLALIEEKKRVFDKGLEVPEGPEREVYRTRFNEIEKQLANKRYAVPDAPYKKDWPLLTFRRMLWQAAEDGSDWLAWNTSEVVQKHGAQKGIADALYDRELPNIAKGEAKRLGLSKDSVQKINVGPKSKPNFNEKETALLQDFTEDNLGPELMENVDTIVADNALINRISASARFTELERKDFGERINELRKIARKQDRARVNGDEAEQDVLYDEYLEEAQGIAQFLTKIVPRLNLTSTGNAWGLRLTPEIREKILKDGLPKFAAAGVSAESLKEFLAQEDEDGSEPIY